MLKHRPYVFLLFACVFFQPLWAAPYVPRDENEVLERLPTAMNATARELRDMRIRLERNPRNLALAAELAWRYVGLGRSESDPRFYGYAEGVLQPWWHEASPPTQILLLRATLRQNRHEFALALEDLEQILSRSPRAAQAWLTQATIQQVQGNYQGARYSCLRLMPLAEGLVTTTCLASVMSLSGQASQAYEALRRALDSSSEASGEIRRWSLTALAEMALRLGKTEEAEKVYKQALALGQRDAYLLGSYADFLLDQGRPEQVEALLDGETRADGLLLRLALALQRLGSIRTSDLAATLAARFAASRARGESLHQGEEARFTLYLLHQPQEALRLAQRNWGVQREPRDARILLEAAIEAHDAAPAQPVIEMFKRNHTEDARLASLVAQVEAGL